MQYANKKWPTAARPVRDPLVEAEADFLEASALFGPDSVQAISAGIALRLMQRMAARGLQVA
jgi:hypothetical protein